MGDSRRLGAVRVAISVAVLASVPPSWGQSHALSIGATVIARGCPATWSLTPDSLIRMSRAAAAPRGAVAPIDARGTLASLDASGRVLTITP
jgi:hypothetical protein